jgi:DNA-binding transcriptional ArsR family regulator
MKLDYDQMASASEDAGRLLRALANPHRMMILCLLADGEKSVGDLGARIDLAQSAFSQHLARLRADGIVTTRREAQRIYYSLRDEAVLQLILVLHEIYCGPPPADRPTKETSR